jgi:hypothetical protein
VLHALTALDAQLLIVRIEPRGATNREETIRHTATIEPGHRRPNESPTSDSGEAMPERLCAAFRWQNRLGELRAKHERVRT